ncbi:unnamed protein product [Cladocopium goreaui]|uniref:Uncharacterized protein n=1 Tax=Cladocopium goreaui TaxID=2562237 RepID=A0A9P1D9R9_9DINO|nr:unnamed protein product [Cladocopium goreaui]
MARHRGLSLLLVLLAPAFVGPRTRSPPRAARVARSAELKRDGDGALGAVGIGASLVMGWSEWTLKTTGCGLPAGPFGLLGATEGLSYLAVLGLVGYQLFRLATNDSKKQSSLVEVASVLAVLATVAGIVVLYFQIQDYGFVPEAVPTEGGRCSNIG